MGVFLFDAGVRPYAPAFVDGTTGGTGGTVSDGGAPGQITFTLPASGHSDPSDGCWIAWPARDVLGRRVPGTSDPLTSPSDLRDAVPVGFAEAVASTAPASGNGVQLWVGVITAPTAALVTSTQAQGFVAILDLDPSNPGIAAGAIRAAGWATTSAIDNDASADTVRVQGDLLRNACCGLYASGGNVSLGDRYVGANVPLLGFNAGDPVWHVLGAYRSGSSTGSVAVTADTRSGIITVGAP